MNGERVCVGYWCPVCQERVVVFAVSDPPPLSTISSVCSHCGYEREIKSEEMPGLKVWHLPEAV